MRILLAALAVLTFFAVSSSHADWTGTKGLISIRSDAFVSQDYSATQTRQFNFLMAGLKTAGLQPDRNQISEPGLQAWLEGQFSPQTPIMSSLNIRELYYRESFLTIGRKLEDWSLADERWGLGLYQPQYRWNPVQPESQGLTGISIRIQPQELGTLWNLTLFASLLSIPDQGAGYSIKNGEFESKNPWFSTPPKRAQFQGTGAVDEFRYSVDQPETNRILFNQGYVAKLAYGEPSQGLFIQAAYAYKAAQQLAMAVDGNVGVNQTVDVRVNPAVYLHTLISGDLQYSQGPWQTGFGVFTEKPQEPQYESTWNYRKYGSSYGLSPFVGLRFTNLKFKVGALWINESPSEVVGPKSAEFESSGVLGARYPFKAAQSIEAEHRLQFKKNEGLASRVSWTQSPTGDFSILRANSRYQIDERWSLKADLLFLRAQAEENKEPSLYAAYEDNDSLQLGVVYVF